MSPAQVSPAQFTPSIRGLFPLRSHTVCSVAGCTAGWPQDPGWGGWATEVRPPTPPHTSPRFSTPPHTFPHMQADGTEPAGSHSFPHTPSHTFPRLLTHTLPHTPSHASPRLPTPSHTRHPARTQTRVTNNLAIGGAGGAVYFEHHGTINITWASGSVWGFYIGFIRLEFHNHAAKPPRQLQPPSKPRTTKSTNRQQPPNHINHYTTPRSCYEGYDQPTNASLSPIWRTLSPLTVAVNPQYVPCADWVSSRLGGWAVRRLGGLGSGGGGWAQAVGVFVASCFRGQPAVRAMR
jgi:hypothetical protein